MNLYPEDTKVPNQPCLMQRVEGTVFPGYRTERTQDLPMGLPISLAQRVSVTATVLEMTQLKQKLKINVQGWN